MKNLFLMFVMLLGSFTYAQGATDGDVFFDFSEDSCIRAERIVELDVKISEFDKLGHINIERIIPTNYAGEPLGYDRVNFYSDIIAEGTHGSIDIPLDTKPANQTKYIEDISYTEFTNWLNTFNALYDNLKIYIRSAFKVQIDARIQSELSNYPNTLIAYSDNDPTSEGYNYHGENDALVFTELDGTVITQIQFNALFEDLSQSDINLYLDQIAAILASL